MSLVFSCTKAVSKNHIVVADAQSICSWEYAEGEVDCSSVSRCISKLVHGLERPSWQSVTVLRASDSITSATSYADLLELPSRCGEADFVFLRELHGSPPSSWYMPRWTSACVPRVSTNMSHSASRQAHSHNRPSPDSLKL